MTQRFKAYHQYGEANGQQVHNLKEFDALAYQNQGADPLVGMTELQALRLCNTWNQGDHHCFRYWIEQ